jgi:hypothetical protein
MGVTSSRISFMGYITPKDTLAEHQQEIQAERHRKLEPAGNSGRIVASQSRDG